MRRCVRFLFGALMCLPLVACTLDFDHGRVQIGVGPIVSGGMTRKGIAHHEGGGFKAIVHFEHPRVSPRPNS